MKCLFASGRETLSKCTLIVIQAYIQTYYQPKWNLVQRQNVTAGFVSSSKTFNPTSTDLQRQRKGDCFAGDFFSFSDWSPLAAGANVLTLAPRECTGIRMMLVVNTVDGQASDSRHPMDACRALGTTAWLVGGRDVRSRVAYLFMFLVLQYGFAKFSDFIICRDKGNMTSSVTPTP